MIGIIEKVVVDCLLQEGGDELRQDVFLAAGIPNDRVYRMDKHYPDTETASLLSATMSVTGMEEAQLFQLFSAVFFDVVEDVFPEFIRMCDTSEDLVRKQAKIHALIAAGSREPGESSKSTDKFQLKDHGPYHISVRYKSDLQLPGLYEALVKEAASLYGDEVALSRGDCPEGSGATIMTVKWVSIAGHPTEYAPEFQDLQKTWGRGALHG
ncbi:MAG: heme NO-binding domain-containing protein [Pseudomonadota bacterium]